MHCLYAEFFVILYPQLDLLLVQGIVLAWWKLNVFSYRDTGGESSATTLCWVDSWWVPPAWAVTYGCYGYGAVWYCCIEWLNRAYSYLLFCCISVGRFSDTMLFGKILAGIYEVAEPICSSHLPWLWPFYFDWLWQTFLFYVHGLKILLHVSPWERASTLNQSNSLLFWMQLHPGGWTRQTFCTILIVGQARDEAHWVKKVILFVFLFCESQQC